MQSASQSDWINVISSLPTSFYYTLPAVDILSDILLHSSLDKKDVDAERSVIIREMEEVAQNFQEVVFDILHSRVFEGNPLGYTILGPVENINSITKEDLKQYIDTHYRSGRMVLAASGGVDHDKVVKMAEKYFGGLKHGDSSTEFVPAVYIPSEVRGEIKDLPMTYGAMVVEGISWTHEDNIALMLANTVSCFLISKDLNVVFYR